MNKNALEIWVGFFVLIGILCVGYLTIKLGRMEFFGENHYSVKARFESVAGLKAGASIEIAGVQVVQVGAIDLETKEHVAMVQLKIRKDVELTDDVIASVKTAGLIGDKYIKLSLGGSETLLKPGDLITETESALDVEELISKYVFGKV